MSAANQRLLGGLIALLGLILIVTAFAVRGGDDVTSAAPEDTSTQAETAPTAVETSPREAEATPTEVQTTPAEVETTSAVLAGSFLEDFVQWLRTSDGDALYANLHEASIARYGEDQCREYTAGLAAPPDFDIQPSGFEDLDSWDYETDDQVEALSNIVRVEADRILGEERVEDTFHLAVRDGQVTWLTDCGDPREN